MNFEAWKKRPLVLAVLLLSTGCYLRLARPDESMSAECAVEGIRITSEKPISCENMSINIALARQSMIERGWVADQQEFEALYSGLWIHVRDVRCVRGESVGELPLPGCASGVWWAETVFRPGQLPSRYEEARIEINRDGRILMHELLHHLDYVRGVRGDHPLWKSRGFIAADDDFRQSALPVSL